MRRFFIIFVISAASVSAARQPIWLLEKGIALTLNLLTLQFIPRIAAVCQFFLFRSNSQRLFTQVKKPCCYHCWMQVPEKYKSHPGLFSKNFYNFLTIDDSGRLHMLFVPGVDNRMGALLLENVTRSAKNGNGLADVFAYASQAGHGERRFSAVSSCGEY
jgi:hypothetical protein